MINRRSIDAAGVTRCSACAHTKTYAYAGSSLVSWLRRASTISLLSTLIAFLLCVGCGGVVCPAAPEIAQAIKARRLGEASEGPRSIRAEARVEQWGDGQRIRGTVMMFAQREESLRFDVMTQFGPASTFTSQEGAFALWDQKESKFFEGPSCAANIERLTGLPLRAHEVVALLYGDSRGLRSNSGDDVVFEEQSCDGGTVQLKFVRKHGALRFERIEKYERPEEEAPLQIVSIAELDEKKETVWSVVFEDYAKKGAYWLPDEIRYRMPSRQIDTTIRFKEVSVDVEVPAGAFMQDVPPGLTPQRLKCRQIDSERTH